MPASAPSLPAVVCGASNSDTAPSQALSHPGHTALPGETTCSAGSGGQGIPQGRVKQRGAVPMPGWVSRFSLGGGQWWFMGKEKLAAGPDVPAFPLFLQPPERCSLFSFPDGQEESDGGNCHCLITVQGPLYDGRHGREQGSAALAGRGQPGWEGTARAALCSGFSGTARQGGKGTRSLSFYAALCTNPLSATKKTLKTKK